MAKRITAYGLTEYCIYNHPIVLKSLYYVAHKHSIRLSTYAFKLGNLPIIKIQPFSWLTW